MIPIELIADIGKVKDDEKGLLRRDVVAQIFHYGLSMDRDSHDYKCISRWCAILDIHFFWHTSFMQ
jgi:hypothetical protein